MVSRIFASWNQDVAVHLRPSGYGGQPSRGLPTVAHAVVGKRERRLVDQTVASWNQVAQWLRRLRDLHATPLATC